MFKKIVRACIQVQTTVVSAVIFAALGGAWGVVSSLGLMWTPFVVDELTWDTHALPMLALKGFLGGVLGALLVALFVVLGAVIGYCALAVWLMGREYFSHDGEAEGATLERLWRGPGLAHVLVRASLVAPVVPALLVGSAYPFLNETQAWAYAFEGMGSLMARSSIPFVALAAVAALVAAVAARWVTRLAARTWMAVLVAIGWGILLARLTGYRDAGSVAAFALPITLVLVPLYWWSNPERKRSAAR